MFSCMGGVCSSTNQRRTVSRSQILADEFFHKYKMEGDHRGIAVLLLASLLVLWLVPDRME